MIYEEKLDIRETIKVAKKVLNDYSNILRFLDDDIYYNELRSSWNIGRISYSNKQIMMSEKLEMYEIRNAEKLKIIEEIQKSIAKLDEDEIKLIYYIYLKRLKRRAIERELSISERQRQRLTKRAHISFAKAHGLEIIKKEI